MSSSKKGAVLRRKMVTGRDYKNYWRSLKKNPDGKEHDLIQKNSVSLLVNVSPLSSAEPRLSPERSGSLPSDKLLPHEDDHVTIQYGQTSVQIEATQPPHETENGRETSVITCFPTSTLGHLPEASQVTILPIQMEPERLEMGDKYNSKLHVEKIVQIKTCIQEMDDTRKKYDLQLQNSETAFNEEMEKFEATRKKIVEAMNQVANQFLIGNIKTTQSRN